MKQHKLCPYVINILFFSIFILAYLLNYYYPFIHDDYAYCYIFGENSDIIRPTSERIYSFKDVFESIYNHYLYVNGRFTSSFLMLTFSGLLGKPVFNFINTLVIVIFCYYFSRNVCANLKNKNLLLIPFILLFFSFPNPGQTVFWMTGSLNYLWGSVFALIVLNNFSQNNEQKTNLLKIIWFIFVFFSGWTNESIGIPVAGGLFLYGIICRKKLTKFQKITILCFCLGCALIVFAPGTFARFTSEQGEAHSFDFMSFIFLRTWNLFIMTWQHPIIFLAIITILCSLVKKRKDLLRSNALYINVYVLGLIFLWLLNMAEGRIYFFFVILSWILCLRFLSDLVSLDRIIYNYDKKISLFLLLLSFIGVYRAYGSIRYYSAYNHKVVEQIKNAPSDCFVERNMYSRDRNKYVYVTELSENPSNYHNRVKSFFYHKNYIASWPKELHDLVLNKKEGNMKIKDSLSNVIPIKNTYLLGVIPDIRQKDISVILHYVNEEYSNLSYRQKLMRRLLGTLDSSPIIKKEIHLSTVPYDGKRYFYIPYKKYDSLDIRSMEYTPLLKMEF